MGGKALGNLGIECVRLPTEAMLPIAEAAAKATSGSIIPWLRDKPDHGDADIIITAVASVAGDAELARLLGDACDMNVRHRRAHASDKVLAVALDTPFGWFQVDLISAPADLADFSCRFLSWGDLGTILGQTARHMGLLFGQDGLRLPLRIPNAPRSSILLTADFDAALTLLGWDPSIHAAGFDNAKASAAYVASGRYFDPEILLLERLSREGRAKAKRRAGRAEFVADLMRYPASYRWPVAPDPEIQAKWRERALSLFGRHSDLRDETDRLERYAARRQRAFSGEVLSQFSGLSASEVPDLVKSIINSFGDVEKFCAWRDIATLDEVETKVREVTRQPSSDSRADA